MSTRRDASRAAGPARQGRVQPANGLESPAGGIVRPARRPVSWQPPGPPPAGPEDRIDLWPGPGEDLCYLCGDWRIFQRIEGHRWSLDDLVTAWFACACVDPARVRRSIDLGCGIGSVLMMVAWRLPAARCTGIEAQAVSAALARRSLAYNGIDARVRLVEGDLREEARRLEPAAFDLVTGTPPYWPFGRGTMSNRLQCGPCRFEHRGGIEAYCAAAAWLLAPGGRFVVCESASQGARVEEAAAAAGLSIRASLEVIPREGRPPRLTVFEMARGELGVEEGAGGPVREGAAPARGAGARLMVRDRKGQWTDEFLRVRLEMGLPPAPPS